MEQCWWCGSDCDGKHTDDPEEVAKADKAFQAHWNLGLLTAFAETPGKESWKRRLEVKVVRKAMSTFIHKWSEWKDKKRKIIKVWSMDEHLRNKPSSKSATEFFLSLDCGNLAAFGEKQHGDLHLFVLGMHSYMSRAFVQEVLGKDSKKVSTELYLRIQGDWMSWLSKLDRCTFGKFVSKYNSLIKFK